MNKIYPPSVQVTAWCLFCMLSTTAVSAERVLFSFEDRFDLQSVISSDASVAIQERDGNPVLRVLTGHRQPWPGITLKAPDGHWDLSASAYVAVDVVNVGKNQADVRLRVDTPDEGGDRVWVTGHASLAPGEKKTLKVLLKRRLPAPLAAKLFGMRGFPGGFVNEAGIDPANIDQVMIFIPTPAEDHALEIDQIRAMGSHQSPSWLMMSPDRFFPMIDRFGQFMHKTWPGKIASIEDLSAAAEQEAADLAMCPSPEHWNQYGGWQAGPELQASGHFRVEKHDQKWWLVDPAGRLFWSHGIDCVHSTTGYTPITDREFMFAELPPQDSSLAQFYSRGNWAPHGYYQGKSYQIYNFTGANLLLKYGDDWKSQFRELCHRRLRSWGMNTIANWSDENIYLMRKTPYVATVGAGKKPIQGSSGYWGKFPDVFDPSFLDTITKRLAAEQGKTADDPWCIGYFIDNELSWGDETSLAVATLASPADQVAKQVLLRDLQAKYGRIENLNAVWGTEHRSWDVLLETTTPPDQQKARDDLLDFYTKTAEQYFRSCAEAVRLSAPTKLYLGCRFSSVNDRAVRAAAKYCDVVSFNRYQTAVADFAFPEGIDKPAIIGEFHFGALDRGMFHTGLQAVDDQSARAAAYKNYVQGALQNPWLVGTHWFQYGEQATTGRGDGENYQIGFLDICDTPYPEIVQASRSVAASMYQLRTESAPAKPAR